MKPIPVILIIIATAVAPPSVPAPAVSPGRINPTPSPVNSANSPLKSTGVHVRHKFESDQESLDVQRKKRNPVIALAVLLLLIVLWEGILICCARR